MKLLLCVHGYPPELVGGTELAVQTLARALARDGHEVVVVAGSIAPAGEEELRRSEESDAIEGAEHPVRVVRLHRPDLYFDHWQKSKSIRVAAAFREVLREVRPELVHVHHWIRLTRELVTIAAEEGVPSVVSLHDLWTTCPLAFRVRPDDRTVCERLHTATNCVPCAGRVPPRTPWVPFEAQFMEFGQRAADVARELRLARGILVPSASHGARLRELLGDAAPVSVLEAVPPAVAPTYPEREPLPPPGPGRPLRLGSWGQLSALKGTDFLFEALEALDRKDGVELRLAGPEESPGWVTGLRRRHGQVRALGLGPFEREGLATHPVTEVHAMVCGTRAPESYGLVLEEARALGLPSILPEQGAFAERGGPERGSLLYTPGDAASFGAAVGELLANPARLEELRRALPVAVGGHEVTRAHLQAYRRAVELGSPAAESLPESEWFQSRMELFAEQEWDRGLSRASAAELGFGR